MLHPVNVALVSWMVLLVNNSLLALTIFAPLIEQKTLKMILLSA